MTKAINKVPDALNTFLTEAKNRLNRMFPEVKIRSHMDVIAYYLLDDSKSFIKDFDRFLKYHGIQGNMFDILRNEAAKRDNGTQTNTENTKTS